jgi:tRNA-dihydrouridine synthase
VPTIPIIGNGDVSQPEHAQALIRRTGCAGVMIARAALRTPWLFRRAHALLTTGTVSPEPTLSEKLSVVLRHLDLTAQYDGETRAAIRLRQHVAWYGKSMGHVKPLKEAIRLAPDFSTMRRALEAAQRVFTGSNAVYSDSGHAIAEGLFQAGFNEFSKVTCLDDGSE